MANDPDFIDYVCDQIDDACDVSYRHMFGGTTLYSKGKVVGSVSHANGLAGEHGAAVEYRAVPDHWEGDLLCGSNSSQIATLVERHTRLVMNVLRRPVELYDEV